MILSYGLHFFTEFGLNYNGDLPHKLKHRGKFVLNFKITI